MFTSTEWHVRKRRIQEKKSDKIKSEVDIFNLNFFIL